MNDQARINKFIEESIAAGLELNTRAHIGSDVKLVINDLVAIVKIYREDLNSGAQVDMRVAKQKASKSEKDLFEFKRNLSNTLVESVSKIRQVNELFPEKNLSKDIIKILQDIIVSIS